MLFPRFLIAVLLFSTVTGCSDNGPLTESGSITLQVMTQGTDPDPDGYGVVLDGNDAGTVSDGNHALTGILPGEHSVGLSGVAANCTLAESNPTRVLVESGSTANVSFMVSCIALPPESGSLRLAVSTTGSALDTDGYSYTIDGGPLQSLPVNGSTTVSGLASGSHSVVLSGVSGNCSSGSGLSFTPAIVAAQTTNLEVTITCSGALGQTVTATSVTVGGTLACAITVQGETLCWGFNLHGQLGDGSQNDRPIAAPVSGDVGFTSISAGGLHACALTADGVAYCWGDNSWGQVGDGSTTERRTPVPVAGGTTFREIRPGFEHTCGVATDDGVYCWGRSGQGQVGDNPLLPHPTPTRVAGAFTAVELVSGLNHSCGITGAGPTYCWGSNDGGNLGNGSGHRETEPALVQGNFPFTMITAGGDHTCGISGANATYCWGENQYGEVGNGSTAFAEPTPVAVTGGLAFVAIEAGRYHTCGLNSSNGVYCWGKNDLGQFGNGATQDSVAAPTPAAGGKHFSRISAGWEVTCGIEEGTGKLYCWGDRLVNGSQSFVVVPKPVQRMP